MNKFLIMAGTPPSLTGLLVEQLQQTKSAPIVLVVHDEPKPAIDLSDLSLKHLDSKKISINSNCVLPYFDLTETKRKVRTARWRKW